MTATPDFDVAEAPPDVARGDDFATFYRAELAGQVRRAALILGSNSAANDAVHDAFVAIYARWGQIDQPGPYLNRAVINRCREMQRRAGRATRAISRLSDDADGPEHDVLWDVLERLPFKQRAAVVLRYYARMSEREIAAALDCRPGSVGPWISRALSTMRKELQ